MEEFTDLFQILNERGCIVNPLSIVSIDDPKKINKIRLVNRHLEISRDAIGRSHPRYFMNKRGRVCTTNPNIAIFGFDLNPGPTQQLLTMEPKQWEAVLTAGYGDKNLGCLIAANGLVETLGFDDVEPKQIRRLFWSLIYGSNKLYDPGIGDPTKHELLEKFPSLRWALDPEQRQLCILTSEKTIQDIRFQVAREFENNHPGMLTAITYDGICIEGQNLRVYEEEIEQAFLKESDYPLRFVKVRKGPDYLGLTKLDLLLED